jgi:hypothetical protein
VRHDQQNPAVHVGYYIKVCSSSLESLDWWMLRHAGSVA